MRKTATLLLLIMLAGCGQKGPLYLPKDSAKPAPKASPAAASKDTTQTPAKADDDSTDSTQTPKDASTPPPAGS